MSITRYDVVWCAGVVDTIGLLKTRAVAGEDLPMVGLSSANLPLVEHICALTGVRMVRVSRRYNRLGCGEHCTDPHLHVDSTTGRWELTGARARVFLYAVRPHLHVKGEDADALLTATEDAAFKPRTVEKMTSLGWPRMETHA